MDVLLSSERLWEKRRDLNETLFGIKIAIKYNVQGEDPSHMWLCNHCMIHGWTFRCRQKACGKHDVISTKHCLELE